MSSEWTSISVRGTTKDELEEYRERGESWDEFFTRWVADEPPKRSDTVSNDDLQTEINSLREKVENVLEMAESQSSF